MQHCIVRSVPMLKVLPLDNHVGSKHQPLILFCSAIQFRSLKYFIFVSLSGQRLNNQLDPPRVMFPQLYPVLPNFHKCFYNL